jgi:hypothetical protein
MLTQFLLEESEAKKANNSKPDYNNVPASQVMSDEKTVESTCTTNDMRLLYRCAMFGGAVGVVTGLAISPDPATVGAAAGVGVAAGLTTAFCCIECGLTPCGCGICTGEPEVSRYPTAR